MWYPIKSEIIQNFLRCIEVYLHAPEELYNFRPHFWTFHEQTFRFWYNFNFQNYFFRKLFVFLKFRHLVISKIDGVPPQITWKTGNFTFCIQNNFLKKVFSKKYFYQNRLTSSWNVQKWGLTWPNSIGARRYTFIHLVIFQIFRPVH